MRRMKPLRWAGDVRAAVSAGCFGERAAALPIWDRASSVEGKASMSFSGCCPAAVYAINSIQAVKMVLYPFFMNRSGERRPKDRNYFPYAQNGASVAEKGAAFRDKFLPLLRRPFRTRLCRRGYGWPFTELKDADNQTSPGRRSRGTYRWQGVDRRRRDCRRHFPQHCFPAP